MVQYYRFISLRENEISVGESTDDILKKGKMMDTKKLTVNTHLTGMDFPDPDVIRVGDTYYMASTTMYFFPGGAILRSFDLVHWEMASYVFDSLDDSDAERLENGRNIYGKGMWAPSLRFHNGTFYLAFVSHGVEDTHLFTATDINGPWEHKKIKGYYHDCSLLFDGDRVFIAHGNTDIYITELLSDLSGPKPGGLNKAVITDDKDKVILGYEGSHLYKINDKYVITFIHWPKDSLRTEAVFVSDKIEGPYRGGDCLCDEYVIKGSKMGVAQGGLVDTPDGKWYGILFRDSGAVGRIPVLVPVEFKDGFPVFGNEGKMPENFEVDAYKKDYSYTPLVPSSFGHKTPEGNVVCDINWQWNHVPKNGFWNLKDEKTLVLKTSQTSINPLWARNTYTLRTGYSVSSVNVTVKTDKLRNGDTAGILLLQGDYAMIGINRLNDKLYVVVYQSGFLYEGFQIGCKDNVPYEEIYRSEPIENKDEFEINAWIDFENMRDQALFSVNDELIKILPVKLRFTLELFTGVRFGMCLMSEREPGGEAAFVINKLDIGDHHEQKD